MSPENIGALIDKLVCVSLGVICVYLSVKQKEKLGNKTIFVRLGGIVIVLYNIFLLIVQ